MTADVNMGYCPFCVAQEPYLSASDAYGKVPEAQYQAMRSREEKGVLVRKTMQEDCAFLMDTNGALTMAYNGTCRECGYEFVFYYKVNARTGHEIKRRITGNFMGDNGYDPDIGFHIES